MITWRLLCLLSCFVAWAAEPERLVLCCDRLSAPVAFAADEILAAAHARGMAVDEQPLGRLAAASPGPLPPGLLLVLGGARELGTWAEGLRLRPAAVSQAQGGYALRRLASGGLAVLGQDQVGTMYGGLDAAEAIAAGRLPALLDRDITPRVANRGLKFNLPLDVRTPSYSDAGDQAQASIPVVWEEPFWRAFLDEMARSRFNVLSLWNLEPFPSLVKVPEYPDVALDDVWRTTWKLEDNFHGTATDMVRPLMLEQKEVVKRLPIADKTRFWNHVMEMARDRGIAVYLFTWNIYPFAAAGKDGLTADVSDPHLPDYYRASVRAAFKAFPLLAGIGFTAGERMTGFKKHQDAEDWLWKAYGEAVRDVKREQPERFIRTIHRLHMTDMKQVYERWKDCPEPFELSFKYSVAHMHSLADPPFIKPTLAALPTGRKLWLTIRNDDFYNFRWGDAAFAQDFVRHLPSSDALAGYYIGWDGYVPTYDFPATDAGASSRLVLGKWWFAMRLWGTLTLDPGRDDDWVRGLVGARFPGCDAPALLEAWGRASRTFSHVTQVHWGDIDVKWFPEANTSHPHGNKGWDAGWKTVRDFIATGAMPGSGVTSIKDFATTQAAGKEEKGRSPLNIADALDEDARQVLAWCGTQDAATGEWRQTVDDIAAMARLGAYYAAKIRGAVSLALFEAGAGAQHQEQAVVRLTTALGCWRAYAETYARLYKPQLMTRVGRVDIPGFTRCAEEDVAIARAAKGPRT